MAGAHRFRAVFEPDDPTADSIAENNEGRAFTVVSGQGRILILTTQADLPSAQVLSAALEKEQLACDIELAGERVLDQVRLLEYSAVVLSNVPRFTVRSEDAARRFISLVDEFYDRAVKLIMSAEAPVTELYGGERLRFEFERTESRLLEMQSHEYLARSHRA